jgi:hypothetical protein
MSKTIITQDNLLHALVDEFRDKTSFHHCI